MSELSALLDGTDEEHTHSHLLLSRLSPAANTRKCSSDLGSHASIASTAAMRPGARNRAAPRTRRSTPCCSSGLPSRDFPPATSTPSITNNTTPLMKAAHLGEIGMIRELIGGRRRLDVRNGDGNNALWLACVGNHLDVDRRAGRFGIDINNPTTTAQPR